ncbi:hypothetical protein WJX84_003120 [Apatococcus fuscideae]|uniref:ATP synthase subunit g, mitochondrial n=1 Tax=Apatococcus fuscideae TaxID=2026836 RepID=A0AAW1T2M0_9CHLO
MKKNSQYVVKDPEAAEKLLKQYMFTTLSRIPTGISHCQQEYQQVSKKLAQGSHINMTEAGTYALFAAEVYAWFCVGEIAGRGFTFGGYNV